MYVSFYRIFAISGIISRLLICLPETRADIIPNIKVIPMITAAPINFNEFIGYTSTKRIIINRERD